MCLAADGIFVVQFLYMKKIVENLAFDQIYHEHLLYYNLKNIDTLLRRHGLVMFDAYLEPIHGGSMIGFVTHEGTRQPSERLLELRRQEAASLSNDISTYRDFARRVKEMKSRDLSYLERVKHEGKRVFGMGHPSRGTPCSIIAASAGIISIAWWRRTRCAGPLLARHALADRHGRRARPTARRLLCAGLELQEGDPGQQSGAGRTGRRLLLSRSSRGRLNMEILVTGATGFLGTALSAHLESLGHRIVRLARATATSPRGDSLERYGDRPYDQIYHLAAWTQAGDFCLHHPGEQWLINQQINTNMLLWWQRRQPQAKLIAMGTSCAYAPGQELIEENYLEGQPIDSLFTYAMTKRMLYAGLLALAKQYQMRYLCLVPSTLYGPGYHTDAGRCHFIFDLIRKILLARNSRTMAVLWGDGHQRRELVYIDDFVQAAVQLADSASNQLINIGAGEEVFDPRVRADHL